MRMTDSKLPIFVALLVALVFIAIPQKTYAVDASTCMQNQQTALMRMAQDMTAANQRMITNSPLPGFKNVFCFNQIITFLQTISSISMALAAAGSAIVAAVMGLLMLAINQIISYVCSFVSGFISSITSMLKKWMCIPIPHFSLNLGLGGIGSFAQGSCQGISLLGIAGGFGGTARALTPPVYNMWGLTRQY